MYFKTYSPQEYIVMILSVGFKTHLVIHIVSIFCEIVLRLTPRETIDEKSVIIEI